MTSNDEILIYIKTKIDGLDSKVEGLDSKVDGMRDDLAMVKGGHAYYTMKDKLPLIIEATVGEFIREMPPKTMIELVEKFRSGSVPSGYVDSFAHIDAVAQAIDREGKFSYVVIESSFTVDDTDVERVIRNAKYMEYLTKTPSYGLIVGTRVIEHVQLSIDSREVLYYELKRNELEPR